MRTLSVLFFSIFMTTAIASASGRDRPAENPALEPDDDKARCCSTCPIDTEDPCWNYCWLSC
jgi:hypothetical protein